MRTLALTLLALALLAFGSPVHHLPRTNACPANSVLNASNFTLLALDVANITTTRALTLSMAVDNSTVLAVLNSSTNSLATATNFTMVNGTLVSGAATSLSVPAPGELLEFGTTAFPAAAYCEVFSTSAHGAQYPYTLAVNGNATAVSICTSTSGVDVAVFEPTDSGTYDSSSCTSVVIHILQ